MLGSSRARKRMNLLSRALATIYKLDQLVLPRNIVALLFRSYLEGGNDNAQLHTLLCSTLQQQHKLEDFSSQQLLDIVAGIVARQ